MRKIIAEENILLNQSFNTKEEAIQKAGELLLSSGYIKEAYIETMFEREKLSSTYIGNNIAIPHGTEEGKANILHSGISIIQVPEGVKFGDEIAKLVIAIAGKDNSHMEILSNIAILGSEIENVDKIVKATNKEDIMKLFGSLEQ